MNNKSTGPTALRRTSTTRPSSSMADRLVKMLQGRKGATMNQMVALTGWQPHSVRGMLSRVLRKQRGLEVKCSTLKQGESCYRIIGKPAP